MLVPPPQFEFCEVCKLNNNMGRKHKYLPNHIRSLSLLLSRFQRKLSDVKFFLRNPLNLRPEHADLNRFWCVFCEADISETGSSFSCANTIYHLASTEHLKNLKHFLWKHGGGMDKVDLFRISDADCIKWEKRCEGLDNDSLSSIRGLGSSLKTMTKDIHDKRSSTNINNSRINTVRCFEHSISSGVMPLQNPTIEGHLLPELQLAGVNGGAFALSVSAPYLGGGMDRHMGDQDIHNYGSVTKHLGYSEVGSSIIQPILSGNYETADHSFHSPLDQGTNLVNGCTNGLIPEKQTCIKEKERCTAGLSSSLTGKAQKLNSNRVGAAWSDKRRVELEMEKRGEFVTIYNADWLPNFGGVWQAGTRKESRKEFDKEKRKMSRIDSQPKFSVTIQPYISKRKKVSVESK